MDGKSPLFVQSELITRSGQLIDALTHNAAHLEALHGTARELEAMNEVPQVLNVPDAA